MKMNTKRNNSSRSSMETSTVEERDVEETVLDALRQYGYNVMCGPHTSLEDTVRESSKRGTLLLEDRLRGALVKLNQQLPKEAIEDAHNQLRSVTEGNLMQRNRTMHDMLVNGVSVEYSMGEGRIIGAQVKVVDFHNPTNNDWLVVSQLKVEENGKRKRPDVVIFLNGLPVTVLELKSPTRKSATLQSGYMQLKNYQEDVPSLFVSNLLMVVSDGIDARFGVIGAGFEWFKPWREINVELQQQNSDGLQVVTMIKELLRKERLLHFMQNFVVFDEADGVSIVKKAAGYHQFYAVEMAVRATRKAMGYEKEDSKGVKYRNLVNADRRVGVVWHTQGSGKSLTMLIYAGCIIRLPEFENPTIVVITDRNDLDDQLFSTFAHCKNILRQVPQQAETRGNLRKLLDVEAGGVIFTTIQKYFPGVDEDRHPVLSNRANIVVIADEAHRSQYEFVNGYAGHLRDALPNASFIGFTGTPIERRDASTRAVFGDNISIYDIQQAELDGMTVPIYYEGRAAKLSTDRTEWVNIDRSFEEVTEGEEGKREQVMSKWAKLEAIVGSDARLRQVAKDIVDHFSERCEVLEGKCMIVCMSRRIAVKLYRTIIELRPDWHSDKDEEGRIKVVMTGNATDPTEWQQHVRSKVARERLATRFRNPTENFKVVIVRDMWLTGFDAPCVHTMYIDKPMKGHNLMQAIARVNRVFRTKPGGLVVDYIGLAVELRQAVSTYTSSGGNGDLVIDKDRAVNLMIENHDICKSMFHGFSYAEWNKMEGAKKLELLPLAQEHILSKQDGKERFISAVNKLERVFALSVPDNRALAIRDDLSFFMAVRASLVKRAPGRTTLTDNTMDQAVEQIISSAIVPEGVVDVFAAAGISRPDISVLSEEFLENIRRMPQKNLAVELLRKLLVEEISERSRKNAYQAKMFSEILKEILRRYRNRTVEAAVIIEELISMAKDMKIAANRGVELGLNAEEQGFYDALESNDSAVQVLGDQVLCGIARELVDVVKRNSRIDWTIREDIRAKLRVSVRRVLKANGYPPDKQESAVHNVIKQAELLAEEYG